MKAKTLGIGGLAAAGGEALLLRRRPAARLAGNVVASNGRASNGRGGQQDRWHVVTVNRPPEEVSSDGQLPRPLEELGDKIEVQTRPAPGERGTEIAARLRDPASSGVSGVAARISGDDPVSRCGRPSGRPSSCSRPGRS